MGVITFSKQFASGGVELAEQLPRSWATSWWAAGC